MTETLKRTKVPAATAAGEFKFEESLKRLEKVVEELEGGSLTLELSLKRYEEGVRLAQQLSKRLEQAQRRVEILMKDGAGELTAQPFENGDEREVS